MTAGPALDPTIRERIIADPVALLEDRDLMRALADANSRQSGDNVVDIRGVTIERLEARLDRLEDTHRSVIAAAYENLAGTNQIHRAILALLEPFAFEDFLHTLGTEVAQILRADAIRLVLETLQGKPDAAVTKVSDVLSLVEPGFVASYTEPAAEAKAVLLRQTRGLDERLFGRRAAWLRSEACIPLDLGARRLPGMLVIASEDPHMFKPNQGTDLLAFFGGVFERSMRHWLA